MPACLSLRASTPPLHYPHSPRFDFLADRIDASQVTIDGGRREMHVLLGRLHRRRRRVLPEGGHDVPEREDGDPARGPPGGRVRGRAERGLGAEGLVAIGEVGAQGGDPTVARVLLGDEAAHARNGVAEYSENKSRVACRVFVGVKRLR